MPKIFIPQQWMDQANLEDRVSVAGDQLSIASDGRTYQLESASRFLSVEGGDADSYQLVGKVKTAGQLKEMNADAMEDTVIIGDSVAYRVQQGYAATFTGSGDPVSAEFR
jgi:hypothetical protein